MLVLCYMRERSEQEKIRLAKLAQLRKNGFTFPNDCKVDATLAQILQAELEEPAKAKRFCAAGRIVQLRLMGKAAFVHILDSSTKAQVYIKQDVVGEKVFEEFKIFDIGDFIEVKGYAFVTKTGEKSVYCENVRLLTKCLSPLPEKWHGLSDIEARYRQRYLDLISNYSVRDVFRKRAQIIHQVRDFLNQRNFLEVETPVLHHVAGGAEAKPFRTHHNSLSCDMVLRIALELPLKKLVVGGLERVYEIGRVFRNEGISRKHNPEFTMLEFYQAYATFHDLMDLTQELIGKLVDNICGSREITFQGQTINLSGNWPRVSMSDSLYEIGGVDRKYNVTELADLLKIAKLHEIDLPERDDWGRVLDALWAALVEPKIKDPVFITHHPFSISPLARKNSENPKITDRFELIIAGMEMANGFSELNDAEDQRARFEEQSRRKAKGDEQACDVEEDFLQALEYGMPPTAGEGIGIDRLTMLLSDAHSIRDVILFPQLKPKESESEENE